jgi:gluconokinase
MNSNEMMLVLDIGSSSMRAVLFDQNAKEVQGTLSRRTYSVRTTVEGGAELDADAMFEAFTSALDELLAKSERVKIGGVAASSLASNILAVDQEGNALSPAYLYSDTRDSVAVEELRSRVDWGPIYDRTGCPLHTSYLPARFLWIRQAQPELFERASRWVSLHEFFLLKLFGRSMTSHSFASWTGLLNRFQLDWDNPVLALVGVRREQLSPLVSAKDSLTELKPRFSARWKALSGARFFPALGDGAVANIGSGCTDSSRVAVTVGTSGALRAVIPRTAASVFSRPNLNAGREGDVDALAFHIPPGLWLYHVDERRSLLGGSLNNGGNVFAYLRRTLNLPEPEAEDRELSKLEPDAHGLTVLPFFAGERSPGYRGDARASIVGLSLETRPVEILRATFEAIAYRVAAIFDLILSAIPAPREIIASGSALLHSPVWVQILADVLGRAITVSGEEEASARGAALLALEAVGTIRDAGELAPAFGRTFSPIGAHNDIYLRARERQRRLYSLLVAKG